VENRYKAKRKELGLAIGMALAIGSAHADFSAQFELSGLNGTNGVVFNGGAAGDSAGQSVSAAGDINGDGFDDLVIGAPKADTNGASAGVCYVVFGSDQAFGSPSNLAALNGSNGFVINGESIFDRAGTSVKGAGDVNGDGIDDLVIGASDASPANGTSYSGSTYVVFGTDQGFPNPLELSTINGSNGFVISGVSDNDASGTSVSGAGDVNGDGIDDLVIGAPLAGGGSYNGTGAAYVVFGGVGVWVSPFELSSLDGASGFRIDGVNDFDNLGQSVSRAGDINGDGIDDLVVGADFAGTPGSYAGAAYVIFGSNEGLAHPLALTSLDGTNGFVIQGVNQGDSTGFSVSVAGDINGDTIVDLIIGAPDTAPGDNASAGASYVVFGRPSDHVWNATLALSSLNGSDGFAILGTNAGDESGTSVSAAGDINVDGVDDLIIGAPLADSKGDASGASYVVFGQESNKNWTASLALSSLNGTNGFRVRGASAGDQSGTSVSAAGDVNADGKADFLVGAPLADPNGADSGAGYVVFDATATSGDIIFADSFEQ
jgi:hypothetical protein